MGLNDIGEWAEWVGREVDYMDCIDEARVGALAATLGIEDPPVAGDDLPPGWQWIFFNSWPPQHKLAEDGHVRRDLPESFLPPIPLPRRMWAGGRLRYLSPLVVGTRVTRRSRLKSVTPKHGKSGSMCFVTVEHLYTSDETLSIIEEQDIVYREAGTVAPVASTSLHTELRTNSGGNGLVPSSVLLFRYSALTSNGHRIHYDADYARGIEGYPNLVVHGPLTATLLQEYAQRCRPANRLMTFDFRGLAPLFVDQPIEFTYTSAPDLINGAIVSAISSVGCLAMRASCSFE